MVVLQFLKSYVIVSVRIRFEKRIKKAGYDARFFYDLDRIESLISVACKNSKNSQQTESESNLRLRINEASQQPERLLAT